MLKSHVEKIKREDRRGGGVDHQSQVSTVKN